MIERYQLRYFLAVVDAGTFSRAASQVNVTQPTLSVGIGKLEAALGARLFLRNSQRVNLTDAGARLLTHARSIEGGFNSLEIHALGPAPTRVLRIGVLSTIPTRLVSELILENRASPGADELEIVEGTERDLIARLQRRRIDVALTIIRPGAAQFPSEVLFREGYALAVPNWHAHAQAQVVAGDALAQETMIVRRHCEILSETSRYFTGHGVRPRFSFRSTNDDRTVALVRAGLGITVMPDCFIEPGIARPKLAGFDHQREIGLIVASPALLAPGGSPTLSVLRALRP